MHTPTTKHLQGLAAIFLEDHYISGDTMIQMNHSLDELENDKVWYYYLYEIMASFLEQMAFEGEIKIDECGNILIPA